MVATLPILPGRTELNRRHKISRYFALGYFRHRFIDVELASSVGENSLRVKDGFVVLILGVHEDIWSLMIVINDHGNNGSPDDFGNEFSASFFETSTIWM